MNENGNDKKTIGLYAVILFTSAFIVLLLTAYSQMKFTKSAHEYKSLLSTEEKAKINFKTNLNSALEENSKLKQDLSVLEKRLERLTGENELFKKRIDQLEEKNGKMLSVYPLLIQAQQYYAEGDIVESALILKSQIDPLLLDDTSAAAYRELSEKCLKKAAKMLFDSGRKAYSRKNYSAAKEAFVKAISLGVNEFYSDDCYFYLAYSEFRLGNKPAAAKVAQELLQRFPGSSYRKEAAELLKDVSYN